MQKASDGARRPNKKSVLSVGSEVATSNLTTSHFLGTNQRSWMRPTGPIAAKRPEQSQPPQTIQQNARGSDSAPPSAADVVSSPDQTSSLRTPAIAEKPLPTYDFISPAPTTPLEEPIAPSNEHEQEQRRETVAIPSPNGQLQGQAGDPQSMPSRNIDEVEVVDLTSSQGHQELFEQVEQPEQEHRPSGKETALGSEVLPGEVSQDHAALHELDVVTAHTGYEPQSVTSHQRPEEPEVSARPRVQQNNRLPNTGVGITADPDHRIISSSISSPIRQDAGTTNLDENIKVDRPPSFSSPATGQLLTPAASPTGHLIPQLLRKRPLEIVTEPQPSTRVRLNSGRVSPLIQHFSPPAIAANAPTVQTTPNYHTSFTGSSYPLQQVQRGLSAKTPTRPSESNSITQPPANTSNIPLHRPHHRSSHSRQASVSGTTARAQVASRARSPVVHRGHTYLTTLDDQLAQLSTRTNFSGNATSLRIPWIQDACQHNDLFFLLLNQLFCSWSMQNQNLSFLGLDSLCDIGFRVLELLFGSNRGIHTELVAFLAGWPNSLYSLRVSPELNQWTANIGTFLPHFGTGWEDFRQQCLAREFPPTAREVDEHFRIPLAIVLPRAIFSSIQKQIYPTAPDRASTAVFELFCQDQTQYFVQLQRVRDRRNLVPLVQHTSAFFQQYRGTLIKYWPTMSDSRGIHGTAPLSSVQRQADYSLSTGHSASSITNGEYPVVTSSHVNSAAARINSHMTKFAVAPASFSQAERREGSISTMEGNTANALPQAGHLRSASFQMDGVGPIQSDYMRMQNSVAISGPAPATTYGSSSVAPAARDDQIVRPDPPPLDPPTLLPNILRLPAFITNPVPEQEALHQIHLRQPATEFEGAEGTTVSRLYQYIASLAWGPHLVKTVVSFFSIDFELAEEVINRRAGIIEPAEGSFQLAKRILSTESTLFNLRCLQWKSNDMPADEPVWASTPTYWPQHIFISVNDTHLDMRRKRHHRVDLPIDVTSYVRPGLNNVKVSIHSDKGDDGKQFALAVEVIAFRDSQQVQAMPYRVPVENALKAIIELMQSPENEDEDDMQVVNDSITLSMTDPFSATMVNTPVRGASCKHKECFDLQTFLASRPSDCKDALTSVYAWRCPICGLDARPSSLVIDGFLQRVREDLVIAGETEARAIVVSPDGTWKVKPEENQDTDQHRTARTTARLSSHVPTKHDDAGSNPQSRAPSEVAANATRTPAPRMIEVIELDD